eukprot:TRINITY_DN1113_c0_g1_i1.p2 TRINITY_DN1113_c0_g1~~TRINITY_DN1113_c0_g1_i1.p2  ORF type:complete len:105 (+),score=12.89 TRINITY_DN1113_c0_g1_i1:56-370(+)
MRTRKGCRVNGCASKTRQFLRDVTISKHTGKKIKKRKEIYSGLHAIQRFHRHHRVATQNHKTDLVPLIPGSFLHSPVDGQVHELIETHERSNNLSVAIDLDCET